METKTIFNAFVKELQTSFPDVQIVEEDTDATVKHIETTYYSDLMKVLQRDETFFNTDRSFCGANLSELWKANEPKRDTIWKHTQMIVFASFLHGDIKEKIGTVMGAMKGMWNMSGQENDDVSKILNDEESEGHFKEILEYLQNTRLAKVFMEIVENFNIDELELNFENPQEIMDLLRNPEHPKMKKMITKIQKLIQTKMERGEISQQQILSEIEGIKAKVQSLFGNVFNDMLGGKKADVPAGVLMSNSPEARRQRMLARLQKKQRDKNSR